MIESKLEDYLNKKLSELENQNTQVYPDTNLAIDDNQNSDEEFSQNQKKLKTKKKLIPLDRAIHAAMSKHFLRDMSNFQKQANAHAG